MSTIEPIIGKWQFGINFRERSWHRIDGQGWRLFRLWCLKITNLPPPGNILGPGNYRGFYIKFAYWLPIDEAS